jgi:hypothetical protein
MSILTDLLEKKITFSQAASQSLAWAEKLISSDPHLTNAANAVVSDVKQAASTAVVMADSYVGAAILPAAKGVEVALDAALASVTKGASIPFNGFVNDGIDLMAAAIQAEAAAWALKAKAALAQPSSASAGGS